MKHLKLFFALFAMLALGVGNAWGAEETLVYTLDGTQTGGSQDYATESDITQGDISWKVTGNTTMSPWRIGGKKITAVDRTVYNTTAIPDNISKIIIEHGTAASITVNSFTLIVASDASFSSVVSTLTGTFAASSTIAFVRPDGHDWTNRYYKLIYNLTYTPNSNKFVQFMNAKFYAEESTSEPDPDPTPDPEPEPDPTPDPGTGGTGTINFNSNAVKINAASVTGNDDLGNTWTITTVGTTSYTANSAYYQVGKSSAPATSITFTTTLPSDVNVTAFSAKFGGFTGTAGTVTLKVDDTSVGTGSLNATSDVTISNSSQATGKELTVTVTGIAKGVKVYNISYTYTTSSGGSEPETPTPSVSVAPTSHTFATTNVGETATQEFTITAENTTATLSASIDNTTDFAISAITGDKVIVTYQPQSAGDHTATMTVKAGEEASTTVALTGKAKTPLEPIAGGVIDILNQDWTDVSGTSYKDVAEKTAENTGHSNAKYVAQCAGDKSSIQLRSNNSNSGVVSTISGGVVKRIEVEWHADTDAARTLQIYGSNTAYTAATDLYGDAKGELLGELNKGNGETTLDFSEWTGDYKYIGFRSKSGAMYLTTITITWLPINSKVTIDDAIQNGSINVNGAADLNAVAAGTVLTLDNTPDAGYKFVKYNVYKTDEPTTEIDVENSKFTMPEYDVTVSATFTSIKELDKIEVNTTNVKKTFWQGEAFSSDGLEVTAYYTDGTSAEVTPTNITGGNTANAGEITVTVSYTEGSNTKTTTYNITVKAIENNETTVYTVAQAREIIDAVGNTTVEVYVQGIVSKIVTAFNPTYGNISYDISDDGLKTSDQLQAYRGFSYEGDWFTSADDIQVGDVVVVKGKLKLYNTTYELDEGNQLVELERSDEPKPTAASLPFEFDGNKDDIADVVGMSQTGLGSYSSSPKLKFDDENDNVIIHFDSEPGEFSFALKQNGQNAGTFTVYESENGENYTSVWSGGNLGNGQTSTIESTLSSTARYVKFELTEKGSSTNYGLGQISIKKIDKRQEAGLTWNPATVSLTVGDAFTAPTLSNPKGLAGITFTSDNEALATVTDAGVISLVSGKTGTATITATFADGHADYKPAEATCVITVSPKSEKVVILAQYDGQWYAMKAQYVTDKTSHLAPLPVNYVGGKLYNVNEADKALIEWELAVVEGKATFYNDGKYLSGTSASTNLTLATTACEWTISGDSYLIGTRTFLYNAENNWFRNFGTSNAGNKNYSEMPTVTAPVYATGDAHGRTVTVGDYGTICIPYGSSNYTGAEFYEISWMEMDGATPKGIWLDQVNGALTAGKPYIFKATADEIAIVGNGTTAASPIAGEAGLTGTFTLIQDIETSDPSNTLEGNYMISGNQFLLCPAGCWLNANRAYIDATIIAGHTTKKAEIPGRRRVCLGETSENEATGFENIVAPEGQAVKAIVNGQLIIIRDGVKYNVQGVRL